MFLNCLGFLLVDIFNTYNLPPLIGHADVAYLVVFRMSAREGREDLLRLDFHFLRDMPSRASYLRFNAAHMMHETGGIWDRNVTSLRRLIIDWPGVSIQHLELCSHVGV